jgi:hypothetical protein
MSRTRVLFRLGMPGVGSWNGRWSGEGRNYVLVRSIPAERVAALGIPTSWRYGWSDGWAASVSARVMEKGERRPKSDGFAGYDWMVDNIIRWGTPACQCEWKPDPYMARAYGEQWEQCIYCRTSRKLEAA